MTTLIPKFKQNGIGAVNRAINLKLQESVSVKDFGAVGDGVTDDTTALQNAINYAVQYKVKLNVPPGIYVTTAQLNASYTTGKYLTIEGICEGFDGQGPATIYYNGATNAAISVLYVDSLSRVTIKGIEFYANNKAGTAFYCNPANGLGNAAYNWSFSNVNFASATEQGFFIAGTTDGANFVFTSCDFYQNTKGYNSANQNALTQTFIGCNFQCTPQASASVTSANIGINLIGGSFTAISCTFTNNWIDIYITIGYCVLEGCWSEQSRQFLVTDNRTNNRFISINGCIVSSFPWCWWKINEANRPQPANNISQWSAISMDQESLALTITNTTFNDVFNGANTGVVAPLSITGNQINVLVPSGKLKPVNITTSGVHFQNGVNSYTTFNKNIVNNIFGAFLFQRTGRMNYVKDSFSAPAALSGGTVDLAITAASVYWLSLTASTIIKPPTIISVGDKCTYIIIQGNGGANTITFNSSLVSGGTSGVFSPAVGAGVISSITFEYTNDATYPWFEISRNLSLQHS